MSRLPILSGCSRRDMRHFAGLGTRVSVESGSRLTTVGARGAEVLIVLSGTATCTVNGIEVARFGPGEFFGEVAVLDGGPRTATVIADQDMELLVLDHFEFEALIKASPAIAHRMLQSMALRLRQANAAAVA